MCPYNQHGGFAQILPKNEVFKLQPMIAEAVVSRDIQEIITRLAMVSPGKSEAIRQAYSSCS